MLHDDDVVLLLFRSVGFSGFPQSCGCSSCKRYATLVGHQNDGLVGVRHVTTNMQINKEIVYIGLPSSQHINVITRTENN